MHILFFTYDTIYPQDSGGKTRAYNLIKYAKSNATISLFSFMREGYDLTQLEELKKIGIKTIEVFPRRGKNDLRNLSAFLSSARSVFSPLYYSMRVKSTLLSYIKENKVDLVHFESFYTGYYLSEETRKLGVRQVYGSENIEYRLYKDGLESFNPVYRTLMGKEVVKIEAEEIKMAKKADAVLAVTQSEVEYFQEYAKKTYLIRNGVDFKNFPQVSLDKKKICRLLFVGNFSYFPNRDALEYFVQKIWPRLSRDKFSLTIVGRGATKIPLNARDKFELIEYVPDLYDAYAATDIFISPLRFGGGTNFKVLEAMASGIPVVALSEKVSGITAVNKKHFLTAENDLEFAQCLTQLSEDMGLRVKIGKNARELIKNDYSWEDIGKRLYNVWQEIVYEQN